MGALGPDLETAIAIVSMVDGIWQDQPDHAVAFPEARLGSPVPGRGDLFIVLDVSGEVEGRSEVERMLVQAIRDSYAASRGSISFGLCQALRAANAHLFELNRQLPREQRRMAGVSAVVRRGHDLYIAQAGPAVVYVEAAEKLSRYPAESDWFLEDAPLFAPNGNASAPLGVRREFTCDLAHATVTAGDIFVLATRALTQLATTEELVIAFSERSALEIAGYLEELGEEADVTALIVELMDPHDATVRARPDAHGTDEAIKPPTPLIESLPILDLPSLKMPIPGEVRDGALPAGVRDGASPAEERDGVSEEDDGEREAKGAALEAAPQSAFESAVAAVDTPSSQKPIRLIGQHDDDAPVAPLHRDASSLDAPELAPLRADRRMRRGITTVWLTRALGTIALILVMALAVVSNAMARVFGAVDWEGVRRGVNMTLNRAVVALITFLLLLVRLVLPGPPARQSTDVSPTRLHLPRRATHDPIWLKFAAFVLPVLFLVLAGARYVQQINARENQFNTLVAQAEALVRAAESNPDRVIAREQLETALAKIREARAINDSQKARAVLYRIQDQLNEIDGVAVLYFLPTLAEFGGARLTQVAVSGQDLFVLDRANKRIYRYTVNDVSGAANPVGKDGIILQDGDKIKDYAVTDLRGMTLAARDQDKSVLVVAGADALLIYDLESGEWSVQPIADAANWGDVRAMASFGGNIYLLDAAKHQIYKYLVSDSGYTPNSTPYFPANAQPVWANAMDMAIDGDVWVLDAKGVLWRYRVGTSLAFELSGLSTPLKNPTALFTRPEVDALYIADPSNGRIVEFDKNGRFVRQFKPSADKSDALKNVRDMAIHVNKRKLYFISDAAVYLSNLPQ